MLSPVNARLLRSPGRLLYFQVHGPEPLTPGGFPEGDVMLYPPAEVALLLRESLGPVKV